MEVVHNKLTAGVCEKELGYRVSKMHLFGLRAYLDFNLAVDHIVTQIVGNAKRQNRS